MDLDNPPFKVVIKSKRLTHHKRRGPVDYLWKFKASYTLTHKKDFFIVRQVPLCLTAHHTIVTSLRLMTYCR